jgi:MraZ protein
MGRGSAVFLGEYQHTLDAKGRVSLPRKFREEIGSRVFVTKGLDDCLYVYPAESYRRLLEKVMTASDFDRNSLAVRRRFTAGANEVDIDSAGRLSLAPVLRTHAGLIKDVIVAGVGDRIEIWDAEAWAKYENDNAPTIWEAAEDLSHRGIL